MSDKLGMVQLAARENPFLGSAGLPTAKPFGEQTAQVIDSEVQRIIHECHEEAKALLRRHRRELDALVEALLAKETLDQHEILQVTGLPPAPAVPELPLAHRDEEESAAADVDSDADADAGAAAAAALKRRA